MVSAILDKDVLRQHKEAGDHIKDKGTEQTIFHIPKIWENITLTVII